MHQIKSGAKWMCPFYTLVAKTRFLFRESGGYPFTISNTCRALPSGELEVLWERTFYFPQKTRHFDARMTIDPIQKFERLFRHTRSFYSDLHFTVTRAGTLVIRSGSGALSSRVSNARCLDC